jgi:Arc/MetJ-type ribon-helix-helix transcriptional regulator
MPTATDLPEEVARLAKALADPRPARSGSLVERYVKCSRPGCACNERAEARHGPYFSLTRAVDGRTHTRLIPASQTDLVREQIEAGRRFRERAQALREGIERWADAELDAALATASPKEAEKGGSRRILRTKSRKKSKR